MDTEQVAVLASVAYFDSSALVKRYLLETGTDWVQAWCSDPNHTVALAEIGLVEIAAAFAGKLRGAYLTPVQYRDALNDLSKDADIEFAMVRVDRTVVDEAIALTARHRLRGYDAVHLACALRLNRALLVNDLPPLVMVSSDTELLVAAEREGLPVENPNRHR